jgi:hypothetical protein
MSISYFRRRAAQAYRGARASLRPHLDYEALLRLGDAFKGKAAIAASRLVRMQGVWLKHKEAERQDAYRDSRE